MGQSNITIDQLMSEVESEISKGSFTNFSAQQSDLIAYGAGDIANESEE